MKRGMTTKALCRAGTIGALYVALTLSFGSLAFGPLQIRPSEALCVLPLFYAEAVPGLFVGCLVSNLVFGYGAADLLLGSLATLLAGAGTWFAGRLVRGKAARVAVGGLFPVVLNALLVPLAWEAAGVVEEAYAVSVLWLAVTEAVWVYALGTALFAGVDRLVGKGYAPFLPVGAGKKEKEEKAGAGENASQGKEEEEGGGGAAA